MSRLFRALGAIPWWVSDTIAAVALFVTIYAALTFALIGDGGM